jgi:hypothetical protein
METRKRNDGSVVVFMALMFLCHFLLFGMSELEWIYWTLVECEARELPSYGESAEKSAARQISGG